MPRRKCRPAVFLMGWDEDIGWDNIWESRTCPGYPPVCHNKKHKAWKWRPISKRQIIASGCINTLMRYAKDNGCEWKELKEEGEECGKPS